MSIKSGKWIRRMAASHNIIEPFAPDQVREIDGKRIVSHGTSSYGYDIRCSDEFRIFSNTTPLPAKIYAGEGCAQVLFFRERRSVRNLVQRPWRQVSGAKGRHAAEDVARGNGGTGGLLGHLLGHRVRQPDCRCVTPLQNRHPPPVSAR